MSGEQPYLQLNALLPITAIEGYSRPSDSHAKDSAVADRVHGRPDQLLRPVLYTDAQHRPRRAGIRCSGRPWPSDFGSTIRASRCCGSWLTGSASPSSKSSTTLFRCLFSHTAFKSYPAALIDKKRFDLMTKWLDKLTSYDLAGVDTSDCTGIDDWIERLDAQTPLEVITSSAARPAPSRSSRRTRHGAEDGMVLWKICLLPDLRARAHRRAAQPVGRRRVAELRRRQARPPAHRQHDQARLHRRRRIQIPRPLPVRGRHRSDVPRLQDAGGGVARRARPAGDRPGPDRPAKTSSSPCRRGRLEDMDAFFTRITRTAAPASGYSCSAPTT